MTGHSRCELEVTQSMPFTRVSEHVSHYHSWLTAVLFLCATTETKDSAMATGQEILDMKFTMKPVTAEAIYCLANGCSMSRYSKLFYQKRGGKRRLISQLMYTFQ